MDLRAVWKVGSLRKDDRWAIVFAEVDDRGDWQVFKVLGAESDDLALGYKEGEFIFCFICEATELNAGNHRACGGGQMLDMGARFEIGEVWISVFGMFVVLEGFRQGTIVVGRPVGEVLWILGRWFSRVQQSRDTWK